MVQSIQVRLEMPNYRTREVLGVYETLVIVEFPDSFDCFIIIFSAHSPASRPNSSTSL